MNETKGGSATLAAILIGIGMGGLFDGLFFHQILQWHNLVSNWIPPTTMESMRVNMFWDGIFHAVVWIVTFTGIFLLWRAAQRGEAMPSLAPFAGRILLGWGGFNLVEGILDHHVFDLHYVRQVPDFMPYNLTFLVVGGILMLLLGWMLTRART